MKILIKVLLIVLILLFACGCDDKNITFNAKIEQVGENSLIVTTYNENIGFDKAVVYFDKKLRMDFVPKAGQIVKITILPQIRESYPVQVTAVKIILIEDILGNTNENYAKKSEGNDGKF